MILFCLIFNNIVTFNVPLKYLRILKINPLMSDGHIYHIIWTDSSIHNIRDVRLDLNDIFVFKKILCAMSTE